MFPLHFDIQTYSKPVQLIIGPVQLIFGFGSVYIWPSLARIWSDSHIFGSYGQETSVYLPPLMSNLSEQKIILQGLSQCSIIMLPSVSGDTSKAHRSAHLHLSHLQLQHSPHHHHRPLHRSRGNSLTWDQCFCKDEQITAYIKRSASIPNWLPIGRLTSSKDQ